jgi:hypothetical protein
MFSFPCLKRKGRLGTIPSADRVLTLASYSKPELNLVIASLKSTHLLVVLMVENNRQLPSLPASLAPVTGTDDNAESSLFCFAQ